MNPIKRIGNPPAPALLCPFCSEGLMKVKESYVCPAEVCTFTVKHSPPEKYEIFYRGADISKMKNPILNYLLTGDSTIRDRIRKLLSLA